MRKLGLRYGTGTGARRSKNTPGRGREDEGWRLVLVPRRGGGGRTDVDGQSARRRCFFKKKITVYILIIFVN
jgi:hypothetical protein